jgi:hypothetical protein
MVEEVFVLKKKKGGGLAFKKNMMGVGSRKNVNMSGGGGGPEKIEYVRGSSKSFCPPHIFKWNSPNKNRTPGVVSQQIDQQACAPRIYTGTAVFYVKAKEYTCRSGILDFVIRHS